jgi:hypothetical protein
MMTNVTETMDYYADELKDADRVEAVYEVFKEKGFIERSVHMAPLINVFISKVTKFKAFRNFFSVLHCVAAQVGRYFLSNSGVRTKKMFYIAFLLARCILESNLYHPCEYLFW